MLGDCCVCLVELDKDMATLKCGHVFHYLCISSWHKLNKNCPLCKKQGSQIIKLYHNIKVDTPSTDTNDMKLISVNDLQEKISAKAEITTLKDELADLTKGLITKEANIKCLNESIKGLKKNIKHVHTRLMDMKEENRSLSSKMKVYKSSFTEHLAKHTDLVQDNGMLLARLKPLERLEMLMNGEDNEDSRTFHGNQLNQSGKIQGILAGEIKRLKANFASIQIEKNKLQGKVEEYSRRITYLFKTNQELKTIVDLLKTTNSKYVSENKSALNSKAITSNSNSNSSSNSSSSGSGNNISLKTRNGFMMNDNHSKKIDDPKPYSINVNSNSPSLFSNNNNSGSVSQQRTRLTTGKEKENDIAIMARARGLKTKNRVLRTARSASFRNKFTK